MNNPTTIDRRDVSHAANPLNSSKQIEQEDLRQPLDADRAASLAYTGAQKPNVPVETNDEMRTSFEQPVEGVENKLRINKETHLPEIATPDGT